ALEPHRAGREQLVAPGAREAEVLVVDDRALDVDVLAGREIGGGDGAARRRGGAVARAPRQRPRPDQGGCPDPEPGPGGGRAGAGGRGPLPCGPLTTRFGSGRGAASVLGRSRGGSSPHRPAA